MRKQLARLCLAFLLALAPAALWMLPAQAVDVPDTAPRIDAAYVYNDVLEDGDVGTLLEYYLDYATPPTQTATETYLAVFVDTDGTTQLKSVAPYTYVNSGYGRGLVWIYFSAAEVTALSIDSADVANYRLWLTGNPTLPWFADTATAAMGAAIQDDGGVFTVDTTDANSAAANDVALLPAVPAVNDAFYFGNTRRFDKLTLNIGQAGAGTWTFAWEYWDGDSWEALSGVTDDTTAFKAAAGNHDVTFTAPTNWATTTVSAVTNYFIRARVATYSAVVTQPLGTQAWVNPTDPPKTTATIDDWVTSGDPSVLLALKVLYYADQLELTWALDLIQTTSLGNKLTTLGESYFENVIANLRIMAPAAFSASSIKPDYENPNYKTTFGATATSVLLAGSPVTLASGSTVLNPTGAGVILFDLEHGTVGNVTGAVVAGSPVTLVYGTNNVTITGAGAITVAVALQNAATKADANVSGTGFDLTAVAAALGLSRWVFSGVIWLIISAVIIAYSMKVVSKNPAFQGASSGKMIFPLAVVCAVIGLLLELLHPLVGAVIIIGILGFFVGYILLFRQANA